MLSIHDFLSHSAVAALLVWGDPNLAGSVTLVVEPVIDQLVCNLQGAREWRGAETSTVRGPAEACERLKTFAFSTYLIGHDHAPDALHALIVDPGGTERLHTGAISETTTHPRTCPDDRAESAAARRD